MATLSTPRPVRVGMALTGIAAALTLAGCSTDASTADSGDSDTTTSDAGTTDTTDTGTTDTDTSDASSSATYTDGTYTADGSYATPESVETITVTVTLEDDIITDVEVTGDPQASETEQYQSAFIGGIADEVVGVDIDDISVSRVAGSSLTSSGFNDAIDEIKSEAAAS